MYAVCCILHHIICRAVWKLPFDAVQRSKHEGCKSILSLDLNSTVHVSLAGFKPFTCCIGYAAMSNALIYFRVANFKNVTYNIYFNFLMGPCAHGTYFYLHMYMNDLVTGHLGTGVDNLSWHTATPHLSESRLSLCPIPTISSCSLPLPVLLTGKTTDQVPTFGLRSKCLL